MNEYVPETNFFRGRVEVELDVSNYAIKADLKVATVVARSKLTFKLI